MDDIKKNIMENIKKNRLAPSMLAIDFRHMEDELKAVAGVGVEIIHVDVMDGAFVPNISFGPPVIKFVKEAVPDIKLDVHMMVQEPSRYFDKFIQLGADNITIHAEATSNLRVDLLKIKDSRIRAGVAISPDTPVSEIEAVMGIIDCVLVMSVYPGFGGQKLIPEALDKAREVKELRDAKGLDFDIEMDGGINRDNVKEVLDSGVNIIVAGSAVFGDNTAENAKEFLELIKD